MDRIPAGKTGNRRRTTAASPTASGSSGALSSLQGLRQALGNRQMAGLLRKAFAQDELEVGRPGDAWEREADRVAERAVSPEPFSEAAPPVAPVPSAPAPARTLQGLGHGQPLDGPTRAFLEPRLGEDLGPVRVHTDQRAAETARVLQARAFTVGSDIVFNAGEYAPETTPGRRLLAHEATHVLQQGAGAGAPAVQRAPRDETTVESSPEEGIAAETGGPAFGPEGEDVELQAPGKLKMKELLPRKVIKDHSQRWVSPELRVKEGRVIVTHMLKYPGNHGDIKETDEYYVRLRGTATDGQKVDQKRDFTLGTSASSIFEVPAGRYQVEIGVYSPIIDLPFHLEVSIGWLPPETAP